MLGTILIFIKRVRTGLSVVGPALLLAVAPACGGDEDTANLMIVVTTSIAGDLVHQVTGAAAEIQVLVPRGVEPHEYLPSAREVAALRSADLVVAWGLGLEEGLTDALAAAEEEGIRVLELSPAVEPVPFATGGLDPHTWMDPVRMATAVRLIGAELAVVSRARDWTAATESAAAGLLATDEDVAAILSAVPTDRRKLVTNHDALGYFAARYGFDVVGVAVEGGSTLATPSSAHIAELVSVVRDAGLPAVFADATGSTAVLEAVAEEVGGVTVVPLLTASLAPDGQDGDTLSELLVLVARTIADALASG